MYRSKVVILFVFIASLCVSHSSIAGDCKPTLSHLSSKLQKFTDPSLDKLRNQILNTNIDDVVANIKKSGLSIKDASIQMMEQADESERAMKGAEKTLMQSCSSESEAKKTLSSIKNSNFDVNFKPSGIAGNAISAYIACYWGYLANKEAAIQVACRAR